MKTNISIKGTVYPVITIKASDLSKVIIEGLDNYKEFYEGNNVTITGSRSNTFVNTGLEIALSRLFSSSVGVLSHLGVTDDAEAVTATTVKLDPSGTNQKTILPVAEMTLTGRVLSGQAIFTNVNAPFRYRKIGYLNTATDSGTGLIDVVGGGGDAPYNQEFNIDLTGAATWNAVLGIDIEFKSN
jgi:hypothetical protein